MEETSEGPNSPNDVFRFLVQSWQCWAAKEEQLCRLSPLVRRAEGNPVWTRPSEKMLLKSDSILTVLRYLTPVCAWFVQVGARLFYCFQGKFSGFPWGFLLPPGHSYESHSPSLHEGFVEFCG